MTKVLLADKTLEEAVHTFYVTNFWNSIGLNDIDNQSIANQLCDIGVNTGVGRVGWLAQYAIAICSKVDLKKTEK